MIRCLYLQGEARDESIQDLDVVLNALGQARPAIAAIPSSALVGLLAALGREIVRDPRLASIDGASYMAMWLRKENLQRTLRAGYGDATILDRFLLSPGGGLVKAQPRGVVCHWVASNMPTLGFFSLMLGFLSKNCNILKVSDASVAMLRTVLDDLARVTYDEGGRTYRGKDLAEGVALVSFPGSDLKASEVFSLAADSRLIWGGSDSVRAILSLPQKETCDSVVFGPKYSFAVFDRGYVESGRFREDASKLALDIILFNQMACSSPQVVFVERSAVSITTVAEDLADALSSLPQRFLEQELPEALVSRVINARAMYLLSDDGDVRSPQGLGWTILVKHGSELEEPVQGRCVFLKEVDRLEDVIQVVTRKVQAVTAGISDPDRLTAFADLVTARGADRVVRPGHTHDFRLPWDGMNVLDRLVRMVTIMEG